MSPQRNRKQGESLDEKIALIDDRIDGAIATAELIELGSRSQEIAGDTVPRAAFALHQQLRNIKADVVEIVEASNLK